MQGVLRLFLSLVLGCAVLAYDLSVRKRPQGELGVAIDYSLALKWPENPPDNEQPPRNYVLSSHITFNKEVSTTITDGQLLKIAIDAYYEMKPELEQYGVGLKRNLPAAMGLIAFGKELIIASAQKGGVSFSYDYAHDTPVGKYLQKCQTIWVEGGNEKSEHLSRGSCSEVMAAHMYHLNHDKDDYLILHKARVVTVKGKKGGPPEQTPPCGGQKTGPDGRPIDWGCDLFVSAFKFNVVSADTTPEEYRLNDLAGGVVKKGQIQLCGDYVENRPPTPTPTESIEEGQM